MTLLILSFHIVAGFFALAIIGVALATRKGGSGHRLAGNLYVTAMFAVSLSTLWLVLVNPNHFLLAVGLFSFYLVFTGWRAGRIRDGRPRWVDHFVGGMMVAAGLMMLALATMGLMKEEGDQPWILVVFGSIGLSMALSDWQNWRHVPLTGKNRIVKHLSRMLAGTIATLTAALVVNTTFLPDLVTWLGPTAILTPVIFWWNARVLNDQSTNKGQKA